MKFLCLLSFALFSLVHADVNVITEDLPGNNQVISRIGPLSLDFNAISKNQYDVLDDLEVLVSVMGRGPIVEAIINALEDLRQVIIEKLDPLEIQKAGPAIFITSSGTRVAATVHNFRAEGLRWFVADDIYVNALRLTVGGHITLPWLIVTGSYDIEARVAVLLTHTAGGNFRIFVNRFEAGIDMRLGTNLSEGHLILRQLDIKLFLNDLIIQVDGMTGSDLINSYINHYIKNLTQDFIQNRMNEISELVSTELFDTVNELLKQFTINDLTRN